jgi:hypothetical protein
MYTMAAVKGGCVGCLLLVCDGLYSLRPYLRIQAASMPP